MRCVVGLGNPGKKYAATRHNIGFYIIDSFAEKHNLKFIPSKSDLYKSEGTIVSSDFFLLKPTTYMNLSGTALLDFFSKNPVNIGDVLVVFDDVNLPLGKIRLRKSGSDGGHNGIKSIIYHLENDTFPRLRFGIGSDFQKGEMAQYVLEVFSEIEFSIIEKSTSFAIDLVEQFIIGGYKKMADFYSEQTHLIVQKEKEKNKNSGNEDSSPKNDILG